MDPRSAVLAEASRARSSRAGVSPAGAAGPSAVVEEPAGVPMEAPGSRSGVPAERRADLRPGARPHSRSGPAGRDGVGRAHVVRSRPGAAPERGPERVIGAYASGARARLVRPLDGPAVVPGCRPVARSRPALADSRCVPAPRPRLSRLSRYQRTGGARRLAGEARTGVVDRALAVVAVALASATVVVVLGLLADLVAR